MVWLGLRFDSVAMTFTLPTEKLKDMMRLVQNWSHKVSANIHDLRAILRKLLYTAADA